MKRKLLLCLLAVSIAFTLQNPCLASTDNNARIEEIKQQIKELQRELAELQGYYELENGYFTVGKDIPAGKYTVTSLKGFGSLRIYESEDAFDNGDYYVDYYSLVSQDLLDDGQYTDHFPSVNGINLKENQYLYVNEMSASFALE